MKNIFKYKNIVVLVCILFFSVNSNALTICPVQGLDKKACPIVVDFFDEIAKHNTEFSKHWQNHHWVSQAGENYKPSIVFQEHIQMSFVNRDVRKDLTSYIESVLTKASQKDPSFQQVLDSHNFFIMTVQAMHLELQRAADRFNRSGAPMTSLQNSRPEGTGIKLNYTYDVQVPETDRYLNSMGIYYTTQHRYIHSTYIDSTTYKAGVKVNPVVVSNLNTITPTPKLPKAISTGQKKTIQGVIPNSNIGSNKGNNYLPTNNSNAVSSINKKPQMAINRGRMSTQKPQVPTPTAQANTNVAPPVLYPYNVPKPMKTAGKSNNTGKKMFILNNSKNSNIGNNSLPTNNSNAVSSINKKPQMAINRGRVSTQKPQVPTPTAQANINVAPPVLYPYNVPKPMKTAGKSNSTGKKMPILNNSKIMVSVSKKGSTPPKVVLKRIDNTQNTNLNSLHINTTKTIQNTKPSKMILQVAPKGTNNGNINSRLITQVAGSQVKNNTRHYIIDDNSKVWSCKVSSLGYRVTLDFDGEVQSYGHVETTHIKSTQFSHIPSNHVSGNACLISVHK